MTICIVIFTILSQKIMANPHAFRKLIYRLAQKMELKKNEIEFLATCFFYVTMLEIHNFKLTVTLTIVKNSDNCTKY
jgi:hypothetical protein